MKKILFSALFLPSFGFALLLQAQTTVHFSVDMSLQPEISTEGVFLAGTFNDWKGESMDDSDGDGIYTLTKSLQPGPYRFLFKNGYDGDETMVYDHPNPEIPGDCVTGAYHERLMEVGNDEMDVRYCFNFCTEDCSAASEGMFAPILTNPFLPGLMRPFSNSKAAPTLVDIDGDGDLDVYVSHRVFNGSCVEAVAFEFWENEGTATAPNYVQKPGNIHGLPDLTTTSIIAFVDIDGDGDQDAYISDDCSNATIRFHENTGDAGHPQFSSTPTEIRSNWGIGYAALVFGDLDGDGDSDALINGLSSPEFYYLENNGSSSNFPFEPVQINPFGLSPLPNGAVRSQILDWDCDGDKDILNSQWPGGGIYRLLYLHENTGTPTAPDFSTKKLLSNQLMIGIKTWGDMDGDGDKDLFSDIYYFENISETNCLTSSVNWLSGSTEISIFPNPATGFLTVKMPIEKNLKQVTIGIFNSIGILIRQLEYDAQELYSGVQVDVGDLTPGFYTVKVSSEGQIAGSKFLKINK